MVPALHGKHSDHDDLFGGDWSEGKVGLVILIGVAVIAGVLLLCAVASARFDIGPRLPVTAYLLMAISAIMLLGNYMLTLIPDEIRAGAYLIVFWLVAVLALLAVFKFVG